MERFLTKREVADMLQVKVKTIERWMLAETLPCVKFGERQQNRVRFNPDDIRGLIAIRKKKKEERSTDATQTT